MILFLPPVMLNWRAVAVNIHEISSSETFLYCLNVVLTLIYLVRRWHGTDCLNVVNFEYVNLLTILRIIFALVIAVEKFPIEELDTNYCEYELEEGVDDQDVEDIFERNDDTIKYCLQLWDPVDSF